MRTPRLLGAAVRLKTLGGTGKVVRRGLLPLATATALACTAATTSLAAGSTQVTHFSFTKPSNVCGISGTSVVHGTSVFRDTGSGTYFMSGTFWGVFTADNGKSATVQFAGPAKQTAPPVVDVQAGTVTIATTYGGLFEKFSITGGPVLSVDAGTVTFVDVFAYTGDPNNPVGAFISETLSGLAGPHPDITSLGCQVLLPYLQGP